MFLHMPEQPLLTVNEVAARLHVHRRTVERLIKDGKLDAARLGHRTVRIDPKAVEAYLKRAAA